MKLGEVLLDEKTRVSLSIATFLIVVGAVITFSFTAATKISEIDNRLNNLEISLDEEKEERKAADEQHTIGIQQNNALLIESNTKLTRIEADTSWMRMYVEENIRGD